VTSSRRTALIRVAGALAIVGLLAACASPVARIEATAERLGYHRQVLQGAAFRHVVYDNDRRDASRPLAVYIEGDGSPYHSRYFVASDPTSRQPLMLELMRFDDGPAVYVGRPCYLGLAADPPCDPVDWTTGRFGRDVVDSMAAVIDRLATERGDVSVELYGHSGGGALAVLIARRLKRVARIVTIAGNLDPAAWVRLHGYAPLSESLDPLADGPLSRDMEQLHAAGADDRNIPADLIVAAARRLGASDVRVLPAVTHNDGWYACWPALRAGQ
jgi:hypothetical protein